MFDLIFAQTVEADLLGGIDTKARRRAATQAINKIARDARALAARRVLQQVNLPVSYVSPNQKRLYVSKQATGASLEARITAQGRATSLARFTSGSGQIGKPGLYIEVKPGKSRFLRRAFLIRLPQGNNPVTDTRFNLGLAVRLRQGEVIQNKLSARRVANGLYVLYGPSVNQVFRANDGDGIANDISPEVAADLQNEFLRLLDL